MENHKQREKGNATLGVLAAMMPSWLLLLCAGGLTFWQVGLNDSPSPWFIIYISAVWLTIFPAIAFGSGLICAFFWQPIIEGENYHKWSAWAVLSIFAPTIFGLGAGCLAMMFAYLPCLWLFNQGVQQGLVWWPQKRWRHFIGLRNDWEREDEDLSGE